MAASRKPGWMHGLDQDQISFYEGLDPQQAVCRGRRRHKFPLDDLIPGRVFPGGIELAPVQGVYQLTAHCQRDCGRWIRYMTSAAGEIDWDSAVYGGGGKRKGHYLTTTGRYYYPRRLRADYDAYLAGDPAAS